MGKDNPSTTVSMILAKDPVAAPAVAGDLDGVARLSRLATLAEELGTKRVRDETQELAARISQGAFTLHVSANSSGARQP